MLFLIPIVAGLVALVSASCGDDNVDEEQVEDTSDGNDTWLSDVLDAADAKTPETLDAPAPDGGPMEVETNEVEVAAGDDGMDSADLPKPVTPPAPEASFFSDMPCGYPASLSYDAKTGTLLTTCGGASNALFRSPKLPNGSGDWTKVGEVAGYPSHHVQLSEKHFLVNHSGPDGFTIVDTTDGEPGQVSAQVDFSALSIIDKDGQELSFSPNNPAGAVLAGGKICVATSNMDEFGMDPADTTFHKGTYLCFPYNGDGTVDESGVIAHYSAGLNPTGMAPIGEGTEKFAVLSSNSYNPATGSGAKLEICDWATMECAATDLTTDKGAQITAQISPTLAITSGGTILVGVQKPVADIMGVDSQTGDITFYDETPAVKSFIASIQAFGEIAAASDFGFFGEENPILFLDMNPSGWDGVLETEIFGNLGPSTIAGDKLYQSTTDMSMNGSVWEVDLEGME